jgi:hypothetical protein
MRIRAARVVRRVHLVTAVLIATALGAAPADARPVNRREWANMVLMALGAPQTVPNERVLLSWAWIETGDTSPGCHWNPLNTGRFEPGASACNSIPVWHFPSCNTGIYALVDAWENGNPAYGYQAIAARLRSGLSAQAVIDAVGASCWIGCNPASQAAYKAALQNAYDDAASASVLEEYAAVTVGGDDADCPMVGIARAFGSNGYFKVGMSGRVFTVGAAHHGNTGPVAAPVSGIASTNSGNGYWLSARDGGVFSFGDAPFHGSAAGSNSSLNPVVGIAGRANGYWLANTAGRVVAFGSATHYGDMSGVALNRPVVGMAATPNGLGYWLVAADGGIFSFGNAGFHGSTGSIPLNAPIVGMARTPSGNGYWFVASDGGVFSFAAPFHGSLGANPPGPTRPVVGMAATSDGGGYWLLHADGSVSAFGNAASGCN